MKYALLIYEDEQIIGDDLESPAFIACVAQHRAFGVDLGAARVGGSGLEPTTAAVTVRMRGGAQSVHDGPFAETKEQLGGFYLIEAPDMDAAIAIARRVPLVADGSIEVRPVLGPE